MLRSGSAAARGRKLSALRLGIEFDGKPADQIFGAGRLERLHMPRHTGCKPACPAAVRLISLYMYHGDVGVEFRDETGVSLQRPTRVHAQRYR